MLLLDTCALIWDALQPERLSRKAAAAIGQADELACSDISLWEVAMLVAHDRLDPGCDCETFLQLALAARAIQVLPVTPAIAQRSVDLNLHGDPADRLIAATAQVHKARVVTADRLLRQARAVPTLW